jgi:hypothetical protein
VAFFVHLIVKRGNTRIVEFFLLGGDMMATKLITVRKAKEEVKRLHAYITLVESYEADTLEKLIIKEYAFENSIAEVVRVLERRGIKRNGYPVDYDYVRSVIKGKASDELHRMLRSGYQHKINKVKKGKYGSDIW